MNTEPVSVHRVATQPQASDESPRAGGEPERPPEIIVVDIGSTGRRALAPPEDAPGKILRELGLTHLATHSGVVTFVQDDSSNESLTASKLLDGSDRGTTAVHAFEASWDVKADAPKHAVVLGRGLGTVRVDDLAGPVADAQAAQAHLDIYVL